MFEFMPQTESRIISSYARKDREVVMQQALDSISNDFRQFMDDSKESWTIYTLNNDFSYDNLAHRQLVGLPGNYEAENRHVSEIPCPAYEVSSVDFIEHNQKVLQKGELKTLNIHPVGYDNNWFCDITRRFIRKDNAGKVTSIVAHAVPVMESWKDSAQALQAVQRFYTGENKVSIEVDTIKELTNTQAEILFFLICRKEPKRIARYLNCNVGTVHSCIDRMRLKMDVVNTQQLIDKVVYMDWHKLLPERLMGDKHLSMILD